MTWRLLPGSGGSWSYLGSDGGAGSGSGGGSGAYVLKAGDTMSGNLVINAGLGVTNFAWIGAAYTYSNPPLHVYKGSYGWPVADPRTDAAVTTRFNSGNVVVDVGSANAVPISNYATWIQGRNGTDIGTQYPLCLQPLGAWGGKGVQIGEISGYASPPLQVNFGSTGYGLPATSGSVDWAITSRFIVGSVALDFGASTATGIANWIQSREMSNLGTQYMLLLNPNGGSVGIGTTSTGGQALAVGGNVFLTSSAPRLYADTGAGTHGARFAFQSSQTNGNTVFGIMPNGSGAVAGVRVFSTSTPDSTPATQVSLTAGTIANAAHLSTLPVSGGVGGPIYLSPNNNNRFIFQPDDTATSPALNVTGGILANRYSERLQSIGPAANAAVTIDWNAGSTVYLAVNGANTINHVNHTGANVMFHFLMIECAGNFNTLVWPGVAWSGGTKPSIAGSALVSLMCRDGSYIFGTVVWRQV